MLKELCLCGYTSNVPGEMKHHLQTCPVEAGFSNAQEDARRQKLLRKHGIRPKEFEVFLKLLAKRYEQ